MTRNSLLNLTLAITLTLLVWGNAEPSTADCQGRGEGLPSPCRLYPQDIAERYYTLTARIRLLFIWISRAGIGAGKITWSESNDGASGLALLIGSDPAKAPMRINRWGYILERVSGSCAELVGVMTEADDSPSNRRARISATPITPTASRRSVHKPTAVWRKAVSPP